MGLFGRKKDKRKEQINLNINLNNDVMFEQDLEKKEVEEQENQKVVVKTDEQLIDESINVFNTIANKNKKIIKEYYICKILSRVGLKDLDFNLQVITMDKHVNRLKKECFDLSRIIDNIKIGLKLEYDQLIKLNNQIIDLNAFQVGLLNQLTEINNTSYGHLKISTVTVTINKNNEELETLYNNIAEELKGFKSFEEAAEFIYYNSGDFIVNLVNSYIDYIQESNNEEFISLYDKHYFLSSDVVISLEIKEWIDLYNKLKFVLKLMSKYDNNIYIECHKLFNIFEAKYAILMMRTERRKR